MSNIESLFEYRESSESAFYLSSVVSVSHPFAYCQASCNLYTVYLDLSSDTATEDSCMSFVLALTIECRNRRVFRQIVTITCHLKTHRHTTQSNKLV